MCGRTGDHSGSRRHSHRSNTNTITRQHTVWGCGSNTTHNSQYVVLSESVDTNVDDLFWISLLLISTQLWHFYYFALIILNSAQTVVLYVNKTRSNVFSQFKSRPFSFYTHQFLYMFRLTSLYLFNLCCSSHKNHRECIMSSLANIMKCVKLLQHIMWSVSWWIQPVITIVFNKCCQLLTVGVMLQVLMNCDTQLLWTLLWVWSVNSRVLRVDMFQKRGTCLITWLQPNMHLSVEC